MTDKKGTRLPGDWQPGSEHIDYAISRGFKAHEARRIGEDFRDYWASKPGASGVKLDWLATWRTWVRKEADRQDRQPPTEPVQFGGEQLNPGAQDWRRTKDGKVKMMLEALHGVGVSDEVLTELYREGVGITHINCPRELPTAVIKTDAGIKLWLRAIGGKQYGPNSYACRAGYNAIPYTKGYIERKMEREG